MAWLLPLQSPLAPLRQSRKETDATRTIGRRRLAGLVSLVTAAVAASAAAAAVAAALAAMGKRRVVEVRYLCHVVRHGCVRPSFVM